ncbi:hypothetical protein C4577_00550 [Candidatus Parcubacteria bacterium]|nr:MAG: hypothetical protein C4577_00550 [Candidatus Parcubacteria bacterium]
MTKTKDDNQLKINVNPQTTPILYTDMVFINVNTDGTIIDVCQKIGSEKNFQVVARIGMSREHAKKFVKRLSELLALTLGQSKTGDNN